VLAADFFLFHMLTLKISTNNYFSHILQGFQVFRFFLDVKQFSSSV